MIDCTVRGCAEPPIAHERYGDWKQTFTGLAYWILDPRAEEVRLEDIAHHLSLLCRFGGAVKVHYSVAQHCVLASRICEPENALLALLHDATEAYVGDMVTPLKRSMPDYKAVEHKNALAIGEHFGLGDKLANLPKDVHWADAVLLATEKRDLMLPPPLPWKAGETAEPLEWHINPWPAPRAEGEYLARFRELRG